MAAVNPTGKRAFIDKANSRLVIIAGVAAFIVVFCLVATKTLISQSNYQNRIISKKHTALNQLRADQKATDELEASYQSFISTQQNAINGNPEGSGPQDGDNAKIILDALPSSYDFPALVTSIEAMLNGQPVTINSIIGSDDEVAQSSNQSSATPQPVAMPFQLSITADYGTIQKVISVFEHSIRPIEVQNLQITGGQDKLTLTISAQTYYQPAKVFKITTKAVQ